MALHGCWAEMDTGGLSKTDKKYRIVNTLSLKLTALTSVNLYISLGNKLITTYIVTTKL